MHVEGGGGSGGSEPFKSRLTSIIYHEGKQEVKCKRKGL